MEKTIELTSQEETARILGVYDKNLHLVREATGANIVVRDSVLRIRGGKDAVERAYKAFSRLREKLRFKDGLTEEDVEDALNRDTSHTRSDRNSFAPRPARGGIFRQDASVTPRSEGQRKYLAEIDANNIVFSIGPAGTGKTFLAVAKAIEALRDSRVRRIVLTRPAVEAGERLGFLPGDIQAKVNPYLRPIYDALNHFLEYGQLQRLIENDIVEIVPLAFMRGRTLDEAFIILDEAQNTTHNQMKMFLTRMGERSKILVTGDITQIDLPKGITSGLIEAQKLLKGINGIVFSYLTRDDIVRHPLVQEIVDMYERRGPK